MRAPAIRIARRVAWRAEEPALRTASIPACAAFQKPDPAGEVTGGAGRFGLKLGEQHLLARLQDAHRVTQRFDLRGLRFDHFGMLVLGFENPRHA